MLSTPGLPIFGKARGGVVQHVAVEGDRACENRESIDLSHKDVTQRRDPDISNSLAQGAGAACWRSMQRVDDVSVVGRVGSLIVATRGADGAGEVLLTVRGAKEAYLAWSAQPLPKGSEVLVIGVRGARTVLVEPWPGLGL
jgi:hypothetical protein